jgi:PAS domain-containing protein
LPDKGGSPEQKRCAPYQDGPQDTNKTGHTAQGAHTIDELFRSVTETATDAIISISRDENIILWNRAAERMFGYSYEEAVVQSVTIIMPDRFRQAHKKGITRFYKQGDQK